jgi:hypothetical protein
MKNILVILIAITLSALLNSCKDDSTNTIENSTRNVKISIYVLEEDSTEFHLISEYFFDDDTSRFARRTFLNMYGTANYKSELRQERANIPLPLDKFGCMIKNIEYNDDSSYYCLTNVSYDNEDYLSKAIMDFSDRDIKKMEYIVKRNGDRMIQASMLEDNVLRTTIDYFYDSQRLCTLEVHSNKDNDKYNVINKYNSKNHLYYKWMGKDSTIGEVEEFFYDENGNNIKTIEYHKVDNTIDTSAVYNKVLYKGYLIDPDKIQNFEFDSNNNIIGYTNTDFGGTKYKVKYEY